MYKKMRIKSFSLFWFIFLPFSLASEVIDKIVAIVGDKAITHSEVEEAALLLPGLDRMTILDQLIERELLLIEAEKETLEVTSDELESAVEDAILQVRGRFPTDEAYKEELQRMGMTEEDLREIYREQKRQEILVYKLFQKKFGRELGVSDVEALEFYNTHQESIPPQPDAIKFLGVTVSYLISEEAKEIAKKRVEKILARIRKGEAFYEVAKEVSDDPKLKKSGGYLGNVNIRDLAREFRATVVKMIPGEIDVIETKDAYHIVKCNEKYEDMYNLSDIVVKISPTPLDSLKTQEIVDSVKKKLEKEEKPELANTQIISWGEDFCPLSMTPITSLESVEVGKIYVFNIPMGFQIIKIIDKRAAHLPTWDEIREEIRHLVYQRKQQARYQKLITKLKEEIFVKKMANIQ